GRNGIGMNERAKVRANIHQRRAAPDRTCAVSRIHASCQLAPQDDTAADNKFGECEIFGPSCAAAVADQRRVSLSVSVKIIYVSQELCSGRHRWEDRRGRKWEGVIDPISLNQRASALNWPLRSVAKAALPRCERAI